MARSLSLLWLGLLVLAGAQSAQAHGGGPGYWQVQGNYEVVAQLAPDPAQVGAADLTVILRHAQTLEFTPAARVLAQIDDPTDTLPPADYELKAEGAPGTAIYGTHQLAFPHHGKWQLRIVGLMQDAQVDVVFAVDVYQAGLIQWLEIGVYSLPLLVLLGLIAVKRWYVPRDEQPESGI